MTRSTLNTVTFIGNIRKSLAIGALALAASVFNTTPASALEYVNLLDEPAPRVGSAAQDNGPVSVSGRDVRVAPPDAIPAPLPEPMPEPAPAGIDPQSANARQAAWTQYQNSLASYDQAIYSRWMQREQVRTSWQYTHSQADNQSYWGNQREIERLQGERWKTVQAYFADNIRYYQQMYANDPQKQANVSWYRQWIDHNQRLCVQELSTIYAVWGLNLQKYVGMPYGLPQTLPADRRATFFAAN
jgi:hypothetical protein